MNNNPGRPRLDEADETVYYTVRIPRRLKEEYQMLVREMGLCPSEVLREMMALWIFRHTRKSG